MGSTDGLPGTVSHDFNGKLEVPRTDSVRGPVLLETRAGPTRSAVTPTLGIPERQVGFALQWSLDF